MNALISESLILIVAGWTSGISLYLTASILGISGRMGWISLPGALDTLSNPFIIVLALGLYAIEFVADKVPYVDSLWDSVHTLIRPIGAGVVGALAGSEHGPAIQTAYALAMGTFALDAHALKSSSRLVINTSPEPVSNIAASVAEHSFVIFIFWFFVKHPILACLIILALVVVSFFVIRFLWRIALAVLRSLFKREKPAPLSASKPTSGPA